VTGLVTEGLDELDRPEPAVVIRGDASAEEIAALVTVLQTVASAAAAREPVRRARPEWSAHRRALRGPHAPGPGAWRASALPW
jgi:hypothetical protein